MNARTISAILIALVLSLGQALAARADCCPRPGASGIDIAAAGCCGHCPTAFAPAQEPASLTAKAAPAPSASLGSASAPPLLAALSLALSDAAPASPPSPAPRMRAAPLRL